MELAHVVRITQILIEEGWQFIDEGYNCISRAYNTFNAEQIVFQTEAELEKWLMRQCNRLEV